VKPFIPVNCPTIPENILESELFVIKRGLYRSKPGYEGSLWTRNGGTLLLDEIGDLSTTLQAKLLRVLEEKEIKPLGIQNLTRSMSGSSLNQSVS